MSFFKISRFCKGCNQAWRFEGEGKLSKMHYPINISLESSIIVLVKHWYLLYDSCVPWNFERKIVAVKNLKIGFQVVNFSRYRMDSFFRQLRAAIRRTNIHSQRGHATAKFLESYCSHYCSSSHIENRENDKLSNNFYNVIRYYYLLYDVLPVSYMHFLSGADVCWNQSLVCNANPYDTYVLIEIKGIFQNFSKFILTKKRNIYYMFYYFLISHSTFIQNYVKQLTLIFDLQHLVSCNFYSTYIT